MDIHYGSVWESADIVCRALSPVAEGHRLLSIASAGDNALALLTLDPAEVVVIDRARPQLACVELRVAALHELDYEDLLAFLGVTPGNRLVLYERLRGRLSPDARRLWDGARDAMAGGVIHAGRFERYLRLYRAMLPKRLRNALLRLLDTSTLEERSRLFDDEINGWIWRMTTGFFLSSRVSTILRGHGGYAADARRTSGETSLGRLRELLLRLPATEKPHLVYLLTGNYALDALPVYLRRENFGTIRNRLDRVRLLHGDVTDALGSQYSGFNLSNIFDYMSAGAASACYRQIVAASIAPARIVYWSIVRRRADGTGTLQRHGSNEGAGPYESFHADEIAVTSL